MSHISCLRRFNRRTPSRWGILAPLLLGSVVVAGSLVIPTRAVAAEAPVDLGTSAAFSVLAYSTVTNTGPSVLSDNVGVSPGSAVTGFPPGIILGTTEVANGVAGTAKADALTAFNDADGRVLPTAVPNDLVGLTLLPGLHASAGPMALSGELTLDGAGDPDAVFIFQSPSTLITASDALVTLTNGARACNIVWQVDSSATLGTDTSFQGTILAAASITLTNGTTLEGRAHALNGAVTLDNNVLTSDSCEVEPPTSSGSATVTATPSPGTVPVTPPSSTGGSSGPGSGPITPTNSTAGGSGGTGSSADPSDSTANTTTNPAGVTTSATQTTSTLPADESSISGSGIGSQTGPGGSGGGGRGGGTAHSSELSATGAGHVSVGVVLGALTLFLGLALIGFSRIRRH